MPTDTKINLVINKLTKAQYDTAVANNQISGSQLYCITDVTEIPVTAVNPVTTTGTLTSIGINGTNYAIPSPLLPITSVNPATSTETLTSIGINGTNYELAGSGGSGIVYASSLPADTTGIADGTFYAIPASSN